MVGRHRYKLISVYYATLIFLANYFAKPYTGNEHGHSALVNIANMYMLRSYHGEDAWSFCVSLYTVYLSFRASGIKLCTPGTLQY